MFMNLENFGIESKSKRGFEKKHMDVVITIESTTIMSSILAFQLKLVLMFFHMDLIREFQKSIIGGGLQPLPKLSLVQGE